MTIFTAAPYAIPTTSTPYPSRPRRGLPTHVSSSPSTSRALLRRLNALLLKEHLHPPQPRTALAPVFSLAELTPDHLLGLLEVILATSFDLGPERERDGDDRGDESWQFVLDDDDDDGGGAGMDEHKLQDERILRFLILGLQQALETTSLPEREIRTMLDVLLAEIDSSHRFGGSNSTRSGVKLIQRKEHIIAWIVAGLFEIEDRLLDPLDTQLGHYTTVDRGQDSSHIVAELGIATTGSTSRGTTSATPTTPRRLLFRDSHTQPRTTMTSPLKQALTTYLPPSPSPRLETTPRKSIVGLLRRDKQARATSPSPKSKRQSLETSSSSLVLVKPEMESYERSRPRASSIVGVKMARKRDVSDSTGESDLDLSERTCDCETEGYRETGEGDQTEAECSCCTHMDDGTETQEELVDAVPIQIDRLSDRPLDASAQRPNWHLTVPEESNAKLFPPARFVATPLNRHSPTSSSSSSNEDEYVVNLRRKRQRDEVEKIKLRSCGLDTDLECGPGWVTGWSEKELRGVGARR
ncbi:BZ3500_MvSof-1268-A1-R1_Chr12-1g03653 [Microbotryum saponariae]|uniref:BZ3500_MvSof-1268-A1-R1_Chr12-1g03653 protein n=1 Tax=Microbotryum saponariae TaxID=289078 RepID=A0A2X0NI00_9BASI|nr:BZ3500_MvSof-1268-A1-R1_Chr12-1g03653 [Microbotryum saponariae]SDA05246.1 BZ3501_MvSof-1269-A2-R1_Chr12-1g03230 [Microbotryum saponariae]